MYPTKPLWEICDILLWWTPSRNEKKFWWWENLWCSIADMKEKIIFDTKEKITEEWIKNSNVKLLEKWTLFMSFKLSLWKLSFAWKNLYTNEAIAWLPIKNNNEIEKFFLYYFLLWNDFSKNWTDNSVKWATLNKEKLKQIPIPLPPLPTQQKIVEKLDKIFEKIDKNIEITKKNIANIDEENNAILEKIFKECEEEFGGEKLGEISKTTSWWTPLRSEKNFWWWNIPWLKSWELNDNLNIENSEEFITEEWLQKSSAKIFKKWTLLIAMYGATAGKLWILWFDATTNQAVCSIQNDKNLFFEKYLFYFLFSKRKQIIEDSFWWAQPNISKNYLDNIKIPLPPLPNQQEIVEKLDKIFSANSELKNFYEKNLKNLEELKQSILKQAFEDENFIQ